MRPLRRFPATVACSVAIIAVFIYEIAISVSCCPIQSFRDLVDIATDGEVIMRAGALINGPGGGMEWWRTITAIFVHIGILHIVLNLTALVQLGYLLEGLFGTRNFLLSFFASGIVSSICGAIALAMQEKPSVAAGASGAIFGLLGTVIIVLGHSGELKRERWSSRLSRRLTGWACFNIVLGIAAARVAASLHSEYSIGNAAHIGGLLTGIVIGMLPMTLRHNATSHSIIRRFGGEPPAVETRSDEC